MLEGKLVEIPLTMKVVHTNESFDEYVAKQEAEAVAKKERGEPLTEFEELTLKMQDEPEKREKAMNLVDLLLGKLPMKSKRSLEPTQNAIINSAAITAISRSDEEGGVNIIHLALDGHKGSDGGRVITKASIEELKALLGIA